MDQHYRGDIRVGREYTAARCVGNFIRKRRKQKLVTDIYVDGGTRGSRICLVDTSEHKTIIKTRGGDLTNNELEYLAVLYALDYINNRHKKDIRIFQPEIPTINYAIRSTGTKLKDMKPLAKRSR